MGSTDRSSSEANSACMNVSIVGAGIAGLCAAIAMRKAGHHVDLFEKTPTATAFGAGVVIGYNASKVLTSWNLDYAANGINVAEEFTMLKGDTFEEMMRFEPKDYEKLAKGHRQYYAHRVDLQQALIEIATEEKGPGIPVKLNFSAAVSSYSAEEGTITFEDGTTHTSDLTIAADGIHSLAPRAVLNSEDFEIAHTGTTIIRFMLSSSDILADPKTAPLVANKGRFSWFVGPDKNRWLLQYPVRGNSEQNFGMYSRIKDSHDVDAQEFRFKCDRDSLKRELVGFNEAILALVPKTSEIMPLWKLAERKPLPTWYRGRMLVVGDAAHPMLPNQGQGAGMCVEDAGALNIIFSQMPDKAPKTIAQRLHLFDTLRRPRASCVQLTSHCPYFEDAVKIMWDDLIKLMPPEELPASGDTGDLRRWIFKYDVLEESTRVLDGHLNKST